MPKIGIIDDRDEYRETLVGSVELALSDLDREDDWEIIDCRPFVDRDDYVKWVKENGVSVILMDERLNEDTSNGDHVDYIGSELVVSLREVFKDLPIYSISTYSEDDPLQEKFSSFDDIIDREIFNKDSTKYIKRFIRISEKFIDAYKEDLAELTELSDKIATGDFTDDDVERVSIIQKKLEIPFTVQEAKTRSQWLTEYEKKLEKLNKVEEEIEKYIKTKK